MRENTPFRRRRWVVRLADVLLLPFAVVLFVVEDILWAGAGVLLRRIRRLTVLKRLEAKLATLPPWAVVPLFLVPEALDHIGGVWATVLLVQAHLVSATLVAVFVKGLAVLVAVWIYQTCEHTLLRVAWFARLHAWVMVLHARITGILRPLRNSLIRVFQKIAVRRHWLTRRLMAIRLRLGQWLRGRVGQ